MTRTMDDILTPHQANIRAKILVAAIDQSAEVGYRNSTLQSVANRVGISRPLVNHYFGTIEKLRRAVVIEAIRQERVDIVAQALAAKDPLVATIPQPLRQRVAMSMAGM